MLHWLGNCCTDKSHQLQAPVGVWRLLRDLLHSSVCLQSGTFPCRAGCAQRDRTDRQDRQTDRTDRHDRQTGQTDRTDTSVPLLSVPIYSASVAAALM